jgi:hypothetical protein
MNVVFRNGTLDDVDFVLLAYLPYELPEPLRHLPVKHFLSVFRAPYHVVLDVIDHMRSFPVILHLHMLLKSSAKGEGFTPRGGHQGVNGVQMSLSCLGDPIASPDSFLISYDAWSNVKRQSNSTEGGMTAL